MPTFAGGSVQASTQFDDSSIFVLDFEDGLLSSRLHQILQLLELAPELNRAALEVVVVAARRSHPAARRAARGAIGFRRKTTAAGCEREREKKKYDVLEMLTISAPKSHPNTSV